MKFLLILTTILFFVLFAACELDLSSRYGLLKIESPSGEKFYFHREARGLNYDSLYLSKNPSFCSESNVSANVRFVGLGPIHPFYKFEENTLHLYVIGTPEIPDKFSDTTEIILHELDNLEYMSLKENYQGKGLNFVDIQFDESLKCD